jgi:hypothetical protein
MGMFYLLVVYYSDEFIIYRINEKSTTIKNQTTRATGLPVRNARCENFLLYGIRLRADDLRGGSYMNSYMPFCPA